MTKIADMVSNLYIAYRDTREPGEALVVTSKLETSESHNVYGEAFKELRRSIGNELIHAVNESKDCADGDPTYRASFYIGEIHLPIEDRKYTVLYQSTEDTHKLQIFIDPGAVMEVYALVISIIFENETNKVIHECRAWTHSDWVVENFLWNLYKSHCPESE